MRDTPAMATIRTRIEYTARDIARLKQQLDKDKKWLKQLEKEAKKSTATS